MPLGIQAQEQNKDQDQTSQPQSGGRTEGSQSGGRRAAAQRQRQHMAMLAEKLNLTDAQKAQFQQIGKDMRKQGMAIRQDSSLTDDQKKEKMQDLRKQSHKQMFGILYAGAKGKAQTDARAAQERSGERQGFRRPGVSQKESRERERR